MTFWWRKREPSDGNEETEHDGDWGARQKRGHKRGTTKKIWMFNRERPYSLEADDRAIFLF